VSQTTSVGTILGPGFLRTRDQILDPLGIDGFRPAGQLFGASCSAQPSMWSMVSWAISSAWGTPTAPRHMTAEPDSSHLRRLRHQVVGFYREAGLHLEEVPPLGLQLTHPRHCLVCGLDRVG
jgi:hypothetical protein